MNPIVKTYHYSDYTHITQVDSIMHEKFGNYFIGNYGNKAYLCQFNDKGMVTACKEYSLPNNQALYFAKMAFNSKGYINVVAYTSDQHKRLTLYVFRLTGMGLIDQVAKISMAKIRTVTSFLLFPNNDLLISGWYTNPNSTKDEIYFIKVNGNFTNTLIKRTAFGLDNQLGSCIIVGRYILAFGSKHPNLTGFCVALDFNLNIKSTFEFVSKDKIGIAAINDCKYVTGAKSLILLAQGIQGPNSQFPLLLICSFSRGKMAVRNSFKINYTSKNLSPYKLFIHSNNLMKILLKNVNRYEILDIEFTPSNQIAQAKFLDFDISALNAIHEFKNQFYYFGNVTNAQKMVKPLLVISNEKMDSCKTKSLERYEISNTSITPSLKPGDLNSLDASIQNIEVAHSEMALTPQDECPVIIDETPFDLTDNYILQSEALNLQVTGSTGDIASKGIFARWFLLGYLGNHHLPKGNMAQNTDFYNKPDDFVNLYRFKYDKSIICPVKVNLQTAHIVSFNNQEAYWLYEVEGLLYQLNFVNTQLYQHILSTLNPSSQRVDFMQQYGQNLYQLLLVEAQAFELQFELEPGDSVKMETFSGNSVENTLSNRKILNATNNQPLIADSMYRVDFSFLSGIPGEISFQLYLTLIENLRRLGIQKVGEFALPNIKDPNVDNEVFERLEKTPGFVSNHWLQYKDNVKVNVENYKKRWNTRTAQSPYNLKEGVTDYVSLSETDTQAIKTFTYQDQDDLSELEVSLLDDLNIASLNYHMARMLGLGAIDTPADNSQYIYFIEYFTDKDISDYTISTALTQHLYFSIPTQVEDQRDPLTIKLLPPEYGISVDNATNNALLLTDANGYVPRIDQRFIQIKADYSDNRFDSNFFFSPNLEFESSKCTYPVFYGLKNKKIFDSDWRKPDLAHDLNYDDANGVPESSGVLFNPENPNAVFVHSDEENGINQYKGWPINIFSMAGDETNMVASDETLFVKANTLQPPSNVKAVYIQKENPLLFSTAQEQSMLQHLGNELLFKVDFDYNYTEDKNYTSANHVAVYYRNYLAQNVIGSIQSVENVYGSDDLCKIKTADYNYISQGETVIPVIKIQDKDKFIGANLSYNRKNYVVVEVISNRPDGYYPEFIVKKNEDRSSVNTGQVANQMIQTYQDIDIIASEPFLLIENLSKKLSWCNKDEVSINQFTPIINLDNTAWPIHTDSYKTDPDHSEEFKVKGIWDSATISRFSDAPNPIDPPLNFYKYKIELDHFELPQHSQFQPNFDTDASIRSSVVWRGGTVRVNFESDTANEFKKKTLKVVGIENVGNHQKLIIHAIDDLNSEPIKIGSQIDINYFPGYRVYFKSQDAINFNKSHLEPEEHAGSKYGIVGLTSIDDQMLDVHSEVYESAVGVPAMFFARELIEPLTPEKPIGPLYASPPNYENKASYNITVNFKHKPWGFVPYRINSNKILQLLYQYDTVKEIKSHLPRVKNDEYLEERWQDLLSFTYDGNGSFNEFPIDNDGNTYAFPEPDNAQFLEFKKNEEDINPGLSYQEILKKYITSNLLPIIEIPILYQHIKNGSYIPVNKKQKITDQEGKALDPNDPESGFDMAPMAKKFPSENKVLFVDFQLDSNMSSENTFFYAFAEMSNSLQIGSISEFLGPVQLVNTLSPKPLNVKKVIAPIPDVYNNYEVEVRFEMDPIEANQDLTYIEILRTQNRIDTENARNMTVVKSIAIEDIIKNVYERPFEVSDYFEFETSNNELIPYSETLFYQLRGVRMVHYVDSQNVAKTQIVYSEPSKTFITNVLDMKAPEAPLIQLDNNVLIDNSDSYTDFTLIWNKVAYNATYTLQYLNGRNQWEDIFEIKTNDDNDLKFNFNNVDYRKQNEDGDNIYHKFRIEVSNSSGILNKNYKVYVLGS